MPEPSDDRSSRRRGVDMSLSGLGFELLAAVIGLTLLGLWIDRRFGSAPWGLLGCATVGIVGGLYNFVRQSVRAARRSESRGSEESR